MLGTYSKRLSGCVVLVGALAPLQAQAQLFVGRRLLRELGLDDIHQTPTLPKDALSDGVVACCNECLQPTSASRQDLRPPW